MIAERDRYMTARLREETAQAAATDKPVKRVLAVIGAGHLSGIEQAIESQTDAPGPMQKALAEIPRGSPWPKRIGIALFAIIAIAISILFYRSADSGTEALWTWVLCTGIGSALGAFIGGGHPLSGLTAFVVGPLKPFRPGVPVGAAAAGVEVWIHRPRVADFDSLRDDVIHWTGWWKNRISRTLMVFVFCNFGMMLGEWIAGFRIVKSLL